MCEDWQIHMVSSLVCVGREDLSSKSLYKEWSSRFEELLQAHRAELAGQSASNHQDEVIDVFEPADVCIFFGDLNYRVDMPRLEVCPCQQTSVCRDLAWRRWSSPC
jgi:hypothetical protein